VQDLAASLPARLIPGAAADLLDLCAAPGGKTMQLAAAGHRVTTPTLSGLGERRNAPPREVALHTHIDDIVAHLWFGDLRDVVLVAHSYGGFVAGGVVARAPERIARLVLLDAFLPAAGEAMTHHIGDDGPGYRAAAERDPDWQIPPAPLPLLGITEPADLAWAEPRITGQPVGTFLEPVGPVDFTAVPDRLYIGCTARPASALDMSRARARADGWAFADLDAGHDAMITHPREVANLVMP
jgi:pimeloyl-ACP methyl ester carboxylesterase